MAVIRTDPGGFIVLWFYVLEHPKAQLAVVQVLKPLRRLGYGLKSHRTDWLSWGLNVGPPGTRLEIYTIFKRIWLACKDPDSFARGGPTLATFYFDE